MARARGGFSLTEMTMVIVIMGLIAGLATPALARYAAVMRTRGAANRVAADIAYTRHLAVRTGQGARLVLESAPSCRAAPGWKAGHRYRVLVAGEDSVAAVRDLRLDGAPLCLTHNARPAIEFNSRGLLTGFNNRTIVLRQADHPPDTLTLSAVGRILRRY